MGKIYDTKDYDWLLTLKTVPADISLGDHLGGFDSNYRNPILDHLHEYADSPVNVCLDQVLPPVVKANYPKFRFSTELFAPMWSSLAQYRQHPAHAFQEFLCCFNGSPNPGRQMLVAALQKFKYFNPTTCSKNFVLTSPSLDGLIEKFSSNRHRFFKKFFSLDDIEFLNAVHSFGLVRFDHARNIYNLEKILTSCFVNLVSECQLTSYVPFISEKFLYSVVTRGLFVTYGQPGWHNHVQTYFGFRPFTQIFDYRFDSIINPVERLIELINMLAKFSNLSADDWNDLYEMEVDTIEYNYNHYHSRDWIKVLEQHA